MYEEALDSIERQIDVARGNIRALVALVRELEAKNSHLRQQINGHTQRIAAQSELLARRAEK